MSINVKNKAIFIHVPKTAGTSVSEAFKGATYIAKHISYLDALNNMDTLDDWFTFSFVRNPWDRLYSQYKFTCQREISATENPVPQKYYEKIGFNGWLLNQNTKWKESHTNIKLPHQRQNQIDWLLDSNKNIGVDFLGRFENLQEDWDFICDKIGLKQSVLPVKNKTVRFDDYKLAYDDETYEYIVKYFNRDITAFNYEF